MEGKPVQPLEAPSQLSAARREVGVHARPKAQEIWAVGGGKGGIGKSVISANLAIYLAKMGRKVLLVDADVGGANLHTCLGMETPRHTWIDYAAKRVERLEQVLVPTSVQGLSLISGAHDLFAGSSTPHHSQRMRFFDAFSFLPYEHVILDLGAGTDLKIVDFFLVAQLGLLVALPEPTSIENAYTFLKNAFFRKLKDLERQLGLKERIDGIMRQKENHGIKTPRELLAEIGAQDPEAGAKLAQGLSGFCPKLLLNQVRTKADTMVGPAMERVCKQYFGVRVDYIGYLEYDNSVWMSVRKRRPLLLEFPHSRIARNIGMLARQMVLKPA